MSSWIAIFGANLIVPVIMVGLGIYFEKKVPKEINKVFGYRTTMSMKNKDTWEFAHKYCGKMWKKVGLVLLIITILVSAWSLTLSKEKVGLSITILCFIQLIFLIGSIVPVEKELKKTFDENGNRRK